MNARAVLCLLALPAALGACRSPLLEPRPVQMQHFESRTARGVAYSELFRGSGVEARSGDRLLLDYTLWLEDGRRVDSTLDRGVPLELVVGEAKIVPGLDEGLVGMRAGGRRRITVPPELGYGDRGIEGLIPPGAKLVFEVHVIEVHGS